MARRRRGRKPAAPSTCDARVRDAPVATTTTGFARGRKTTRRVGRRRRSATRGRGRDAVGRAPRDDAQADDPLVARVAAEVAEATGGATLDALSDPARRPPSRCLQGCTLGAACALAKTPSKFRRDCTEYPRRGRGGAATHLHGISTSQPRRRRDPSAEYPRGDVRSTAQAEPREAPERGAGARGPPRAARRRRRVAGPPRADREEGGRRARRPSGDLRASRGRRPAVRRRALRASREDDARRPTPQEVSTTVFVSPSSVDLGTSKNAR